ncbi:MAG: hypothetical protein CMH79_01520 [Nitrospinae bacterium]|nr:hypothetical protein [Nitrospinota bacterium]
MQKKIISYLFLFIGVVFLAVFFGYSYGDLIISFLRENQGIKKELSLNKNDSGNGDFRVSLYFGSSEKNLLKKYIVKIPKEKNEIKFIENIIKLLIKGPKIDGFVPTIPKKTKLRSVFRGENRVLYLDFDRSISENHIGGAWSELMTLNSIVYSISKNITQNFSRIVLLIEGQEALTLRGSISILGSLTMKKDLVSEREIIILNTKDSPVRGLREIFKKRNIDPAGVPKISLEKSLKKKEKINPVGIPSQKP